MPTYGPYSPGTAANDSSIGTVSWDNPNNSLASDDIYTTATLRLQQSYYLKLTNFSVGPLPIGETIIGIELSIKRKADVADTIRDNSVKLVVNNNIVGDDKSKTDYWPTTEAGGEYGDTYDLWGLSSLSNAEVEASNFGIVISCKNDVGSGFFSRVGSIDNIHIYIHTVSGSNLSDITTLFIQGHIPVNTNIPLFVVNHGTASISGSLNLNIKGITPGLGEHFNTTDLFTEGFTTSNNLIPLYLNSNPISDSFVNLYTYGISSLNNNLTLWVQNTPQTGGDAGMILFTKGLNPADSIPPTSGNSSNNVKLYTVGGYIPVGEDGVDGTPSPLSNMNIFLKGALTDDEASNMNLFIKNIAFNSNNSLQLFLYNNTEPLNNNTKLYIKGLGSVDSEGFTPGGSFMNMFIQRNTAGATNLFMSGPSFNVNNAFDLYINSNPTASSGMALSLPYSWDNFNKALFMYINGW